MLRNVMGMGKASYSRQKTVLGDDVLVTCV